MALSRLRVDGRLIEVRADQLRFTVDEAAVLLARATEVVLSMDDVRRLVARTEGWAAGLRLAALRLADRPDGSSQAEFIDRFTGADRHVVDYLGEEVLTNQPERVRDFLPHTSLLDRICADLGDAVTGRSDSATTLDEIYRANLFLIPLDDEQRWFRYHQLFRGILRHELARVARRGAGRVELAAALVTAARAARACGADDLARQRHDEARSVLRECPDPGPVLLDWFGVERRAALAQVRSSRREELTDRERAILAFLPGPRTQREIAGDLFVTLNTLRTHLRAIYRKLGAGSRNEAVARARELGLL